MTQNNVDTRVNFYELILLFSLGSIAGTLIEGIWALITVGTWQYHTALVIGPFNIIYGFGAVGMALAGAFLRGGILRTFITLSLVGAGIEFLGSLFQERFFLSRSWDYSAQIANIEGRISLLSSLAWGALGVIFLRLILPLILRLFRRISRTRVKIFAIFILVFLTLDGILTVLALSRWQERRAREAADGAFDAFLDEAFPNPKMRKIFSTYVFIPKNSGDR